MMLDFRFHALILFLESSMRKMIGGAAAWFLVFMFVAIVYGTFIEPLNSGVKIPFSDFLDHVESGRVASVKIHPAEGNEIEGKMSDGSVFRTQGIIYEGLISEMRNRGVVFEISNGMTFLGMIAGLLISWFPMLLLVGVWVFFMRQMQAGGNRTMTFGKSRARMISNKKNQIRFNDVAGIDEAKEELNEIVEFLKEPSKFVALGAKIPKGCLLIGPPGTGKTLLAKAIAGEANVPFFTISGSDFVEMFVGVGASRVRDMFDQGKKNAPCMIFMDEIDAVGRHRGIGLGGGNDEREQTLNQLLVEMDGFKSNEGVIIIAATNRPDVLDPALLRPGRFDRRVTISAPDIRGREEILAVHTKNVPVAPDVDKNTIARGTPGFTGADLANLVNESALVAARKNRKIVTMDDFEYARDKVMMGAERRSMIMKNEEKKLTAYHEAGHAIVSLKMPDSDPIHKATIIPRGMSLGLVMRLPEHDRVSLRRGKMIADITVAMGGRCAEEIIFGYDSVTSGASSDLKQATDIANSMVSEWGMSEKIGPIRHDNNERLISDEKKNMIDQEVLEIVNACKKRAHSILTENIDSLHLLSNALLERETLTGEEIKDLLDGKAYKNLDADKDEEIKHSSFSDK